MTTEEPEFIRLLFTSIHGRTHSIEIVADRLDDLFEEGICFDGSSVLGYAEVNSSDLVLKPLVDDPLPAYWDSSMAIVPCGVYETSGAAHECDPVTVLRSTVRKGRELGYELVAGFELEFFLTVKSDGQVWPADGGGYFTTAPDDRGLEIRRDIIRALKLMGIETTAHHHEVAKGQHEIGLKHCAAEKAALSLMLARHVIREIAWREGLVATFMPKPFMEMNGSGMHIHQSIWTKDLRQNLFHAEGDVPISELGKWYVAGLIEYASSLAAIVAPTVNSYKRLVPGYEAPTRVAWGPKNRSTMIRIPHFNGSEGAARIEFRCPDPLCSPHLALASTLAAGLIGIERQLDPPELIVKDLFHYDADVKSLPGSLIEALKKLERAQALINHIGRTAIERFMRIKQLEWDEYASSDQQNESAISEWEINKYLHAS